MSLPTGKLPPDLLHGFLATLGSGDQSVVVGAAVGEDAAVIDVGGPELLVAKTDPITLAARNVGSLLLAVNANDLATMGATPRWLLASVLMPPTATPDDARSLLDGLAAACRDASVALVGGHTEVTDGLEHPVMAGCLLGTVPPDRLVRTAGARVGDALVLTGGIAIEGSAILAIEHADRLRAAGIDTAAIDAAACWLDDPGVSILEAARRVHAAGRAHAMHDPTEGGLATALHELAEAAAVGVRIDPARVLVLDETRRICDALGLDPLGLLASGALLAALDPADVAGALHRLSDAGIPAAEIGRVVSASDGRTMVVNGRERPLPVFDRDELARFLDSAE